MIKLRTIIVLMALSIGNFAYAEIVNIEFKVAAMQGLTDQYKVRKILSTLDGVGRVILNVDAQMVAITFDDEMSSLFDIKTALASQGYPATNIASQ